MNTHEYRGFVPGRDRFRWLIVLIALFAMLCTRELINRFVTRSSWQPYLGVQTKKLARLREIAPRVRTMFLGTSHVYNGIDALEFDNAVLKECGVDTFSFNAGVPDLRGPELADYLDTMASIPGLRPDVVFVELVINPTPNVSRLLSVRTRYHFNRTQLMDGIAVRLTGNIPWTRKAGSIAAQVTAAAASELNLGVLADLALPSCPRCEVLELNRGPLEERLSLPFDRGSAGEIEGAYTDRKGIRSDAVRRRAKLNGNARELSQDERHYLANVLDKIARLGAKPYALNPPLNDHLEDRPAIARTLKHHFPKVPVFDYLFTAEVAEDSALAKLFNDKTAWLDNTHLNPDGAKEFARLLAADFCEQANSPQYTLRDR